MNRTIATEFPEFDIATLPAIPSSWADESWHNDACPCFALPNGWRVYVDFEKPAERENPEAARFAAVLRNDDLEILQTFETDDWQALLVHLVAAGFAANIRRDLTAAELAEAIRRNGTEAYSGGACATHDFMDSNMPMAEAFESVMGREVNGDSEDDCALWGGAWGKAKAAGFSL